MSETLYLLSIGLIPATVLVVFAMKYGAAAFQARARGVSEENYRSLLSGIQADLAEIKTRLTAVEKILKAVE